MLGNLRVVKRDMSRGVVQDTDALLLLLFLLSMMMLFWSMLDIEPRLDAQLPLDEPEHAWLTRRDFLIRFEDDSLRASIVLENNGRLGACI